MTSYTPPPRSHTRQRELDESPLVSPEGVRQVLGGGGVQLQEGGGPGLEAWVHRVDALEPLLQPLHQSTALNPNPARNKLRGGIARLVFATINLQEDGILGSNLQTNKGTCNG